MRVWVLSLSHEGGRAASHGWAPSLQLLSRLRTHAQLRACILPSYVAGSSPGLHFRKLKRLLIRTSAAIHITATNLAFQVH